MEENAKAGLLAEVEKAQKLLKGYAQLEIECKVLENDIERHKLLGVGYSTIEKNVKNLHRQLYLARIIITHLTGVDLRNCPTTHFI